MLTYTTLKKCYNSFSARATINKFRQHDNEKHQLHKTNYNAIIVYIIIVRSGDYDKTLSIHFSKGYGHKVWKVGLIRDTN